MLPDYRGCLVMLTLSGADAQMIREFDFTCKQWINDWFELS
jgi:prolyl oligopeptidase PreP (S9A serine peptidase family)